MPRYVALIHKDPETAYGVSFYDFPGCITAAETLEDAVRKAKEVLAFHIQAMLADHDPLPDATPIEKVMADPESHGALPFEVSVSSKAVRVNITLEEGLLAEIDAFAGAKHKSRSQLLAEAARRLIRSEQG